MQASPVATQDVQVQVTESVEALLQQESLGKSSSAATGGQADLLWGVGRAQLAYKTRPGQCHVLDRIGQSGCASAGDEERRGAAAA